MNANCLISSLYKYCVTQGRYSHLAGPLLSTHTSTA